MMAALSARKSAAAIVAAATSGKMWRPGVNLRTAIAALAYVFPTVKPLSLIQRLARVAVLMISCQHWF